MLEVDTRKIEGTAVTVSLYLSHDGTGETCAVVVRDASGETRARRDYTNRGEALAHYRHTFAYPEGLGHGEIPTDEIEEPPATTEAAIARIAQ